MSQRAHGVRSTLVQRKARSRFSTCAQFSYVDRNNSLRTVRAHKHTHTGTHRAPPRERERNDENCDPNSSAILSNVRNYEDGTDYVLLPPKSTAICWMNGTHNRNVATTDTPTTTTENEHKRRLGCSYIVCVACACVECARATLNSCWTMCAWISTVYVLCWCRYVFEWAEQPRHTESPRMRCRRFW